MTWPRGWRWRRSWDPTGLTCASWGKSLPELPELETVSNDLRPFLVGRTIEFADLRFPTIVRHPEPDLFREGVTGQRIESMTRRGKYILLHLSNQELFVVHLGMTGQLRYVQPEVDLMDHTHAVFTLDDGSHLRYRDTRRFGRLLFGSEA